ncbi:hypothetical protein P175DRAFT_0437723 [Aspergillus ochraceoroseus IBT 24754]|uniref:Auxiliary Activity family 9 catalytic domain-containing protein n=2 Tax=Aspergillus ochraceoroseus TaxID=138278 RepID=A0A2T5LWT4_9EURO|nr:uncharacterized protein P175DRAFT_0437723 [Aspergillus ochraceoroseus IBT 24754]KKK13934.1 hypothetical protein AOCH_003500 [Aspergillus ochraceoroseus]PTU20741.1 hypothetical protein P175DRAFT_0437723 [Aspergillus ochraceoroseus IBT 24754]
MTLSKIATLAGFLASASLVAGHGYATSLVIDGKAYGGWIADNYYYMKDPPDCYGWSTTVTDNGFVAPDSYTSDDIICHRGATPAALSAPVAAGSTIEITWNTWPESHKGPIINYLAKCNGDCSTVDKTSLKFVKIQADALIDASANKWITDDMIADNFTATLSIPSSIAPGNYVLRHEIIGLHSAGQKNGAQNYPQCFNLKISGSGTANPTGTSATTFYTPTDPGILFNLYAGATSYPMPGPELYSG